MDFFCYFVFLTFCVGDFTLPEGEIVVEFVRMGTSDTWEQIRDYYAAETCEEYGNVVDEPYRKSDEFSPSILGGYAVLTYAYSLEDDNLNRELDLDKEKERWCGASFYLTGDSTYVHVSVIALREYSDVLKVKTKHLDVEEPIIEDLDPSELPTLSPMFRKLHVSTETCELICTAHCLPGLKPPCDVVLAEFKEATGPPKLDGWTTNRIYDPRVGRPPKPFYQCDFSDWTSGYGGTGHLWSPYNVPLEIKQRYGPDDMPMDINPGDYVPARSLSFRRWRYTTQFMGHVLYGLLEEGDHRLFCGKKFAAFGVRQGYIDSSSFLDETLVQEILTPPVFLTIQAYEEYLSDTFAGAVKYGALSIPPKACLSLCPEEFCFHDYDICPVKIVEIGELILPPPSETLTQIKYKNVSFPLTIEETLDRGYFGELTAWPFSTCLARSNNCKWEPRFGNTTLCGLSPLFPCPMAIKGAVGNQQERACGSVWELETIGMPEKIVMYGVVVHLMPDKTNGWAMSHEGFKQLCPHTCGTIPVCRVSCPEYSKSSGVTKRCACPTLQKTKVDRCGQFCDGCVEDFPGQGGTTEYDTIQMIRARFIGNIGNSFIRQPSFLVLFGILLFCF